MKTNRIERAIQIGKISEAIVSIIDEKNNKIEIRYWNSEIGWE